MTLQIVTATLGMALLPALCTAITRCVCWASFCEAGNLAVLTATGKFPSGSAAAWFWPPPQADRAKAMPTPAVIPQVHILQAVNAGGTYHQARPLKPGLRAPGTARWGGG